MARGGSIGVDTFLLDQILYMGPLCVIDLNTLLIYVFERVKIRKPYISLSR